MRGFSQLVVDDKSTTEAERTLINIVVRITQNTSSTGLENQVEWLIQRSVEPSECQASQDVTVSNHNSVAGPVFLDGLAVLIRDFLDEGYNFSQ